MSIKDDFKPYVDGNNLLAPNPVSPGTKQGSDNGTLFLSEYFIMLKKNGALEANDPIDFVNRLSTCIDNGLLNRAPGDSNQEGPDDYYGVANGCMEMGNTSIPRGFLRALIKGFGCLNNAMPGHFSWSSFLVRQPQLICSILTAAFPSFTNPIHWIIRIVLLPLYVVSALVLAFSSMDNESDTDSRRLAWHLGNCTSKVSVLNKVAFWIWKKRLFKDYTYGMKDVAAIYYKPSGNNPYSKWWIT